MDASPVSITIVRSAVSLRAYAHCCAARALATPGTGAAGLFGCETAAARPSGVKLTCAFHFTRCCFSVYIYNIAKKDWKKVTSANCPPPRSAHQAVIVEKPDAPEMWIFVRHTKGVTLMRSSDRLFCTHFADFRRPLLCLRLSRRVGW